MKQRWTKEMIWDWYNARPWMVGCNYMSADCANRVDQWQSLGFDERLATVDEELALAAKTGFNTLRLILEFVVWQEEHDQFYQNFDRYLDVCAKHGLSCMIVLANDCMPPKTELWKMPATGVQHYDWGYHGGRKHSQHGTHTEPAPHFYLDDPVSADRYFEFVREVVTRYKDDTRICIWDLFNEPGNSRRAPLALPYVKRMFETVRACDPSQPLTIAPWFFSKDIQPELAQVQEFCIQHSDIITYHFYGSPVEHVEIIRDLKKYGRPLMNTEWLQRCSGNTVYDTLPLFYLEKIGCYNWGFVAGKYQTYEPYESMWDNYRDDPNVKIDFTKWMHDLYRPNLRPYDPKEVDLFRHFRNLADAEFKSESDTETM